MAKKDELIELETPLVQPQGLVPHGFIVRLDGRTVVEIGGRYWPIRLVVLALAALAAACLAARLLAGARG